MFPDEPLPTPNGEDTTVEAPRSLREVAEASWSEIENDTGADDQQPEPPLDGRARDEHGRFVSKEAIPGEQTQVPAPDTAPPQAQQPIQPPPGSSNEPPAHWSPEDKAMFARQTPEARDFLLRRHGDMERDYQGKVQASASAVNFVSALGPIFSDPVIHKSLEDVGANPYHAISEWASFHKRAMSDNMNERIALLHDLAVRMKIPDPAAAFGQQSVTPPPGNLPPEVQQNPVFRYLADQLSTARNDFEALRNELQGYKSEGERQRQDEVLRLSRQSIDQFADATDAQGNRLRPDFDAVLPELMKLVRADPEIDLVQAYETARWMNVEVRKTMLAAQQRNQQQDGNLQRARDAVRSNVRGNTVPVVRPKPDEGQPRGLRAAIEESAEEVGFEG
jgi:hypothetical protein